MFSLIKNEKAVVWKNWSRSVMSRPQYMLYPSSIEEIQQIVKTCTVEKKKLRIVGSGHSFTPLNETKDVLISLDLLQGVDEIDEENLTVSVWAGTKLRNLGQTLLHYGYSPENLGDINKQSLGGALATGTHGTGRMYGNLSTQIVSLTAVLMNGTVIHCSESENKHLFKAFQVSLGTLGIIVKYTLKIIKAEPMKFESRKLSLQQCMQQLASLNEENEHFEFFSFPYSETVQIKIMNKTNEPVSKPNKWHTVQKYALENVGFWLLSQSSRFFPKIAKHISRLSAKAVPLFTEIGYKHDLLITPRLVKFQEMEYSIPAQHMKEVIEKMNVCIEKYQFHVHFPIECRYVKGDDISLSPSYGRDSAYIAVHMFKGMAYKKYFTEIEKIFHAYEGRPHWGKMHTLTASQLKTLYPEWDQFQRIRKQLDPNNILMNQYTTSLFE